MDFSLRSFEEVSDLLARYCSKFDTCLFLEILISPATKMARTEKNWNQRSKNFDSLIRFLSRLQFLATLLTWPLRMMRTMFGVKLITTLSQIISVLFFLSTLRSTSTRRKQLFLNGQKYTQTFLFITSSISEIFELNLTHMRQKNF